MRIYRINSNDSSIVSPFCIYDKEEQGNQEVEYEPNSSAVSTKEHVNLKEQILAIQRTKTLLGIENLAAASLNSSDDGERVKAAIELAESPSWDNFQKLRIALNGERDAWTSGDHTCQAFTWAMAQIVNQLEPSQITNIVKFQSETFARFSESLLMSIATGVIGRFGSFNFPINQISNQTRINAAATLSLIVEKVGERLDDEALIIKKLLKSPIRKIREMAIEVALATYQHKWRKNIEDTGLIAALKKEENDQIRAKIVRTVALANPKALLEEHAIEGSREKFCPLTRVRNDISQDVREAIFDGVCQVILAQVKKGNFYFAFIEVPELSPKNILDCFNCAAGIITETSKQPQHGWGTNPLFPKSCQIISTLLEAGDAPFRSSSLFEEYQKLKEKLTQINFTNFTDHMAAAGYDAKGGIKIVDHVLSTRAKAYEKPLQHFFELRKDVIKLHEKHPYHSCREVLSEVTNAIDDAIERNLGNVHIQKIRWGVQTEFNSTVKDLLDLLERSQKDSCKVVVLDLLAKLNQNGVCLEEGENVPLEEVLSDENKTKLKNVLRRTASSQLDILAKETNKTVAVPVIHNLISSPQGDTLHGKALILYRSLRDTESFKDYYGMLNLKNQALMRPSV